MGIINDNLLSVELLLNHFVGTPVLDQNASITQRIQNIKASINSIFPEGPVVSKLPLLICLEGPDKMGKTVQSKLLARAMNESALQTERLNEFDDSENGVTLRELFMAMDSQTFPLLLVTQARIELYTKKLEKLMNSEVNVILDRGMLSSFAYGCGGLDLSPGFVEHFTTDFFVKPDLTILFTGKQVAKPGSDKFEKIAFEKISEAFKEYAPRFEAVEFPCNGTVKSVHTRLVKLINEVFDLNIKPLKDCNNA